MAQGDVGAERPAQNPWVGQIGLGINPRAGSGEIGAFPMRIVERPTACPWRLTAPRVLSRSTATPARAGSRAAILRSRWESMLPPWVVSGCRAITVARTGPNGRAISAMSGTPSAAVSRMGSRLAGRTLVAVIGSPRSDVATLTVAAAGSASTRDANGVARPARPSLLLARRPDAGWPGGSAGHSRDIGTAWSRSRR